MDGSTVLLSYSRLSENVRYASLPSHHGILKHCQIRELLEPDSNERRTEGQTSICARSCLSVCTRLYHRGAAKFDGAPRDLPLHSIGQSPAPASIVFVTVLAHKSRNFLVTCVDMYISDNTAE